MAAWRSIRNHARLFYPSRWYHPVRPELFSDVPRFYWFSWEEYKLNRKLVEAGQAIQQAQPSSLRFAARLLFQTYPYPETHAAAWWALYCRHVRLHPPLDWFESIRGLLLPTEELARAFLALCDYPHVWPLQGPFLPACEAALHPPPVFKHNAFTPHRLFTLIKDEALRLAESFHPVIVYDKA